MSITHWYARYIGDYQRKTSHLSMVEHGAYTLILDWYYANEQPIPLDTMQVHRICRAFALEEQQAVDTVLNAFFTKTENGWINDRVEEEIEKKQEVSNKRKKAAEKRWRNNNANGDANAYANAYANGDAKRMLSTSTSTSTSKNIKNNIYEQNCFPEFWDAYPLRKGKKKAALLYQKLVNDGVEPERIIAGAKAYNESKARSDEYTKHPATWLYGEHWLDEEPKKKPMEYNVWKN